jgi:uncharacterized protein
VQKEHVMTENSRRSANVFRELSKQECTARLLAASVGRVAVCTHHGPVIIPVNYLMHEETVMFRTAPYTVLAGHAWDQAAFEIDELDHDMRRGWSVLARGRASPIEDPESIEAAQLLNQLAPWAAGSRRMFIGITPDTLSGREVAF